METQPPSVRSRRGYSGLVVGLVAVLGLGVGFGMGFSTHAAYAFTQDVFRPGGSLDDPFSRKDQLYFSAGDNSFWEPARRILGKGDGLLTGRLMKDDAPVAGVQIQWAFADGVRTAAAMTDGEGRYTFHVPKGTYHLRGVVLLNQRERFEGAVLVNRLLEEHSLDYWIGQGNSEKTRQRLEAQAAKAGTEGAAREVVEREVGPLLAARSKSITVGAEPIALPQLHYRRPLTIQSPQPGETYAKASLVCTWEAHPRAETYEVQISDVVKEGQTTSYRHLARISGMRTPRLAYPEIARQLAASSTPCPDRPPSQGLFALRVVAFDVQGQPLTASGEDWMDAVTFRVK